MKNDEILDQEKLLKLMEKAPEVEQGGEKCRTCLIDLQMGGYAVLYHAAPMAPDAPHRWGCTYKELDSEGHLQTARDMCLVREGLLICRPDQRVVSSLDHVRSFFYLMQFHETASAYEGNLCDNAMPVMRLDDAIVPAFPVCRRPAHAPERKHAIGSACVALIAALNQ